MQEMSPLFVRNIYNIQIRKQISLVSRSDVGLSDSNKHVYFPKISSIMHGYSIPFKLPVSKGPSQHLLSELASWRVKWAIHNKDYFGYEQKTQWGALWGHITTLAPSPPFWGHPLCLLTLLTFSVKTEFKKIILAYFNRFGLNRKHRVLVIRLGGTKDVQACNSK